VRARYSFQLESDFSAASPEAEADPGVPEAAPPRHWEGALQAAETQHHPDGSTSRMVWFDELSTWTDGQVQGPGLPDAPLVGLVVDLRTFDDHEILALDHLEHWVGAPRLGDTLLPLWFALSPEIPDLDPGVPLRRRVNLPFLLEGGIGVVLALDLTWSLLELAEPEGGSPTWHVHGEGSVRGDGRDRAGDWLTRDRFDGRIQADIWVDVADHEVESAEFEWDLTISARVATATDGALRGDLVQHQRHRGVLRRLAAPTEPLPSWAPPNPRPYRAATQVREVLAAASPALTACMTGAGSPPVTWVGHLAVVLDHEGRVTATGIDASTPWADGERCVQDHACGLVFPPDAEPGARWGYTVSWVQGAVQPYPSVEPPERTRGPLFIALPETPTSAQRARIDALFGAPPAPASGLAQPTPCPR
jgi:hypothetical protein